MFCVHKNATVAITVLFATLTCISRKFACSLELNFVGGSSKRSRYFDWSRLLALELELRKIGYFNWSWQSAPELVLRIGFLLELALGIRYMYMYVKLSAPEPTTAGTQFCNRRRKSFTHYKSDDF